MSASLQEMLMSAASNLPQTTGKTLEEIDVLFARDDAKHDLSSDQIIAGSAEARLAKEKDSADSAEHVEGGK